MPTQPSSSSPSSASAGAPPFSLDDVRQVARLLHEADLSEIEIETLAPPSDSEGAPAPPRVRLQLRRGTDPSVVRRAAPVARPSASTPAADAAQVAASGEAGDAGEGVWEVLSPTVGVFRAPQPPLQVGDEVKAGQKAGAVEALKIPSDIFFVRPGRVAAVLAEDLSGVEYGQPLFRLESTSATDKH